MKSQALEQVAQRLEANGHDLESYTRFKRSLIYWSDRQVFGGRLTQNVRDYAARQWDAEERAAYLQICDAVIRQLQDGSDLRCWFFVGRGCGHWSGSTGASCHLSKRQANC